MSKGDPVGRGGTEGAARWRRAAPKAQYWPMTGKKKKTHEVGLFFLVPTSQVMLHPKWVKKPFPAHVRSIVSIV